MMNPMQSIPPQCGSCLKMITGRYKMQINNEFYHETCVVCTMCGIRLTEKCFAKDRELYCRTDYYRYVLFLVYIIQIKAQLLLNTVISLQRY